MSEGKYLVHYASPYYDPVKAHEYYMQHRQLKGRHSTKGMSDKQKEALSYTKYKINTEKKGVLKSGQKSISDKYKKASEEGTTQIRDSANEAISNARETLSSYMKAYGKRMSKWQKMKLQKKLLLEISKIRETAKTESANYRKSLSDARKAESDKFKSDVESHYSSALDKEYGNIKTQLPGKPAKQKKGRKSSTGRRSSSKSTGTGSKGPRTITSKTGKTYTIQGKAKSSRSKK